MRERGTSFRGEDESAGQAAPVLDLAAAGLLGATGMFFAVLSLRLPVPGSWLSAPGLLPFLTSSSLAVMALALGFSALRRGRTEGFDLAIGLSGDASRRLVLIASLVIYVAALEWLDLEGFVQVFGLTVPMGGFEPATVVFLTVLLRLFWTDRLWHCVAVAFGWTLLLILGFRFLFNIPLPG